MLIDPITKANPSNADLLKLVMQVHECVEDGKRVTKEAVAEVAVKAEAARLAALETSKEVTSISSALGLPEGKKQVSGLSSPFKAFVRTAAATATAMGSSLLLYRFAAAVAPGVWTFLQATNEAILRGNF